MSRLRLIVALAAVHFVVVPLSRALLDFFSASGGYLDITLSCLDIVASVAALVVIVFLARRANLRRS